MVVHVNRKYMYKCNFGVTHISYDSHIHVGASKYIKIEMTLRVNQTVYTVHTLGQRSKVSTCMSLH